MKAACLWDPLESGLLWTWCGTRGVIEQCVQRSRCPTEWCPSLSPHRGDWGPDKGTAGRAAAPESLASGPEAGAYSWGAEPGLCGGVAGGAGAGPRGPRLTALGAEPALERRG